MIATIYWVVSKSGQDSDNYLWVKEDNQAAWGPTMTEEKLIDGEYTLQDQMEFFPNDEFEEVFTGTIEDGNSFIRMRELLE